mmetsp:Transcript_84265/g.187062  ORF Transcript_84265/g.187062 Transcript_84265/m.187062 type:complete len:151 (+) Transcript_84265:87-539(+)
MLFSAAAMAASAASRPAGGSCGTRPAASVQPAYRVYAPAGGRDDKVSSGDSASGRRVIGDDGRITVVGGNGAGGQSQSGESWFESMTKPLQSLLGGSSEASKPLPEKQKACPPDRPASQTAPALPTSDASSPADQAAKMRAKRLQRFEGR